MDELTLEYLKGVVEAILFISEKPVTLDQIRDVEESLTPVQIRKIIQDLKQDYAAGHRGMVIVEVAGGYQMMSSPNYVSHIRNFFKIRVKEKLSRPALETLAIIAYKQPVSRGDVEIIRGVNSDGVVNHLLNKGLIKVVGRKDVPGRPYLYGTTKQFCEYFGLKSLNDLPRLEEFEALVERTEKALRSTDQEEDRVERTGGEAPSGDEAGSSAGEDAGSDDGPEIPDEPEEEPTNEEDPSAERQDNLKQAMADVEQETSLSDDERPASFNRIRELEEIRSADETSSEEAEETEETS